MEGFFLDIVKGQLGKVRDDRDNYLWHSFWFLIRKSDRVAVGSADFKDVPGQNSEVEIGYGLGKEFEGRGYMTEAVKSMCAWALEQPGVHQVIAETDSIGEASHGVLRRCGFTVDRRGETWWWRLSGV
ncbi:GNAT family N-acetyltransferase [Breznakiella homolactica]|uniref:GNAT family N-acetyltransferase n=1 Tax=Breznakiella homolactica TaxID=2798577 RepID=A0A7T7XK65_9SPIR|nr:GNAT family N-acetyltransferase [Breznakiella homolactica]QQO07748.1 GNAT family N-acetyltransferase [Breznakiella homolactica]